MVVLRSSRFARYFLMLVVLLALACGPIPPESVVEPIETSVADATTGATFEARQSAGDDGGLTSAGVPPDRSTAVQATPPDPPVLTDPTVPANTPVPEDALTLESVSDSGIAPEPGLTPTSTPSPPSLDESALSRESVDRPDFSNVSDRTPAEVVAYLTGRLPEYPGSDPTALFDFSASNILETMDTAVLDGIARQRGEAALQQVYYLIARAILTTLREQYGDRWVLVPLEAGHGGKKGFNWDAGSGGTEADHTRAVVGVMSRLVAEAEYDRIILRPIHNDAIADDFGLPPALNKPTVNRMLMRQARASMLAAEAAAWNASRSGLTSPVAVHELSIHFNAGSGGALVLHQGDTVRPEFVARSIEFGRRYLRRVTADLNSSGLLPTPLRIWTGTGLHDDVMMYRPSYFRDEEIRGITLRYAALQGIGYLPRYVQTVLAH